MNKTSESQPSWLGGFYAFLDRPLHLPSRFILLLLLVPLLLQFFYPMWRISMFAPQYPEGLSVDIFSFKLVGGHSGNDIAEINELNHYIGMQTIDRAQLADLDWLPFAFGLLSLVGLRVAAIGNVRALIDFVALSAYFGAFSMARFYYKMYSLGHHLDPRAAFKMEPFTPVMFGTKQIANFLTQSYPQTGTLLVGIALTGFFLVLVWHLAFGLRDYRRARARPGPVA
jgi:copper chaperone NosL